MGLFGALLEAYTYSDCCVGSGDDYEGVSSGYLNHPYHSTGYDFGPLCVDGDKPKPRPKTSYDFWQDSKRYRSEAEEHLEDVRARYRIASRRYKYSLPWNKERRGKDMIALEGLIQGWEKSVQRWEESIAYWSGR